MILNEETYLADLPPDHRLRNRPLAEIGAEFRWKQGTKWVKVLHSWRMAQKSFNELGEFWTGPYDWRAGRKF